MLNEMGSPLGQSRFSSGRNKQISYISTLLAVALFIISMSIGFINTDENSESKKVSVKIKIGNSNCSGSGICEITKVPKDQFSEVSGLNRDFYGYAKFEAGSGEFKIQTRTDWMSEQTYTQYFSGTNFVLEDDFIIPKNTIGNNKAITLLSGSYPIQREGEQLIFTITYGGN